MSDSVPELPDQTELSDESVHAGFPDGTASESADPASDAVGRKRRKPVLWYLLVTAFAGLSIYWIGLFVISWPAARVVETSLEHLGNQQFAPARQHFSPAFKRFFPETALADWCQKIGLTSVQSIELSDRRVYPHFILFSALVTTREKTEVPLELQMVKADAEWQINAMCSPAIPVADRIPERQQLITRITETLDRIDRAAAEADFGPVYEMLATPLREAITLDEFQRSLQFLQQQGISIAVGPDCRLRLNDGSRIDPNRTIPLKGSNRTPLTTVKFSFRFLFECGDWRLAGLALSSELRLVETASVMTDALQEDRVLDALSVCSRRIREAPFEQFQRTVTSLDLNLIDSVTWDSQIQSIEPTTGEKLRKFYVEADIDLTTGRSISIGFLLIEEEGVWRVDGFAPALPKQPSISGLQKEDSPPIGDPA